MLENAVRICEAKFGVLFQSEGEALRAVALHGAPALYAEERRRNPVIRPSARITALGRAMAMKQPLQIADSKTNRIIPMHRRASRAGSSPSWPEPEPCFASRC
jgi:hypothetical protein